MPIIVRRHPCSIEIAAFGPAFSHAIAQMRHAGMRIVMVETGDDPGHAPSRASYEKAGFERWPVARYFRKL